MKKKPMPSAFKSLILALLITFSFISVSKFSVANDLSNLSDDEVCDGYFAKDKEGDDYFLERRKRGLYFYCENRRCLATIPEAIEFLEWYKQELASNIDTVNSTMRRYRSSQGKFFNGLMKFLDRCEDATMKIRD